MSFLGSLIPAAASVFGSIFSAKSARDTNEQNARQSQQQEDFQREMSNTAHQREVADLKAAGLNPLLSANAGASTPSGASAVFQNPYANLSNDLSTASRLALDVRMQKAQIANVEANTAKTVAETVPTKVKSDVITGVVNSAKRFHEASQARVEKIRSAASKYGNRPSLSFYKEITR